MNEKTGAETAQHSREFPPESILVGFKNRLLQALARMAPGESTLRVQLHRWRGVRIGRDVRIGLDVLIETAYPQWVWIGDNVQLGIRCVILAHIHTLPPRKDEHKGYISVRLEDDTYIGPGAMVLSNVTVGRGAVVTAGSVVTSSVPPLVMVQGNPARPIARCGIPLGYNTPLKEFYRHLKPFR